MNIEEQVTQLVALASEIDVDEWERRFTIGGQLVGGRKGILGVIGHSIRELQRSARAIDQKIKTAKMPS